MVHGNHRIDLTRLDVLKRCVTCSAELDGESPRVSCSGFSLASSERGEELSNSRLDLRANILCVAWKRDLSM